ncbi:hypothetical protein OO006_07635 [Prosthecochloris sp. SCSIO W1101]|uniref:hypothetical protein n=1 Tax=Prosthecochloris sp. SCSIO W1101 TaxID=2992242 RepID=UPI00223E843E|nr:hypothetical protein [Prosthecochloris sp. SCSIO W1101]UZJ40248.1 hypothetical protein OO006_07635 [Prosthecochloris sp. SCSIO W1101]
MNFRDFVLKKQHIPEQKVPDHLRRVSQYQKSCRQNPDQEMPPESVTSFGSQLAKSHEDWQILQARRKGCIYLVGKRS